MIRRDKTWICVKRNPRGIDNDSADFGKHWRCVISPVEGSLTQPFETAVKSWVVSGDVTPYNLLSGSDETDGAPEVFVRLYGNAVIDEESVLYVDLWHPGDVIFLYFFGFVAPVLPADQERHIDLMLPESVPLKRFAEVRNRFGNRTIAMQHRISGPEEISFIQKQIAAELDVPLVVIQNIELLNVLGVSEELAARLRSKH